MQNIFPYILFLTSCITKKEIMVGTLLNLANNRIFGNYYIKKLCMSSTSISNKREETTPTNCRDSKEEDYRNLKN